MAGFAQQADLCNAGTAFQPNHGSLPFIKERHISSQVRLIERGPLALAGRLQGLLGHRMASQYAVAVVCQAVT